jgi:hypothetical protein
VFPWLGYPPIREIEQMLAPSRRAVRISDSRLQPISPSKRARHDQSSFHGILLFWRYQMEQKF